MVCVDSKIRDGSDFSSARILIDTSELQVINSWMIFSVAGKDFNIYVKEVGMECIKLWCFDIAQNHNFTNTINPSFDKFEDEESLLAGEDDEGDRQSMMGNYDNYAGNDFVYGSNDRSIPGNLMADHSEMEHDNVSLIEAQGANSNNTTPVHNDDQRTEDFIGVLNLGSTPKELKGHELGPNPNLDPFLMCFGLPKEDASHGLGSWPLALPGFEGSSQKAHFDSNDQLGSPNVLDSHAVTS